MHSDREILEIINEFIEKEPFKGNPPELYAPLDYILSLGGKRIRPVMLLMACEMHGGDLIKAMPAALGIELFHNFSLIHDDIMDKAPIRRGKPTVHEKWDANTAILSGDTMLVKAYEKFLQVPEPYFKPALAMFTKTAQEVCEGQQYDMNFERRTDVTVDDYIEMIRLKTAVLIGASLYLGGLLADASGEDIENLYQSGIHTGLVFQLRDDLLDTYGDEGKFGKMQYGDIAANKKTFLYLKAMELADHQEKQQLAGLFSTPAVTLADKINTTLGIFNRVNVRQHTEDKIRNHHQKALQYFDGIKIEERSKQSLRSYLETLTGRIF